MEYIGLLVISSQLKTTASGFEPGGNPLIISCQRLIYPSVVQISTYLSSEVVLEAQGCKRSSCTPPPLNVYAWALCHNVKFLWPLPGPQLLSTNRGKVINLRVVNPREVGCAPAGIHKSEGFWLYSQYGQIVFLANALAWSSCCGLST